MSRGEHPYRIRLVNGRCFFLNADNRCRIHNEISYDAKPPVCRAFPLAIQEVGGRQYARLSYWCPTAAANTGRPLEQQARWLKDTAMIAGRRTAPLTLDGTRELSPRQFDSIHSALRRCVAAPEWAARDRLAAAAALLRRLAAAGPTVELVAAAEAEGLGALAREGLAAGHAASARRVLTLYLLQDRAPGRWVIIPRLFAVVLFNAGLWRLHSRTVRARAGWRGLRRVAFQPSATSDQLLTRYLCSKIDSRSYVGGDASLITGFNLLVVAYAMIEVLARMRAADAARPSCNDDDIREAVSAADLLVVEHPGLDQAGVHRRITDATLGSPDLAAGLLGLLTGPPERALER
jgi:hypothetical protein